MSSLLPKNLLQDESASPAIRPHRGSPKFARNNAFQAELRKGIDEYFERSGRRRRDMPQMYVKSSIILSSFMALYVLLVFVVQTWWLALPIAILLGLAAAEIGFNIQHDGGHGAYSNRPWVNKVAAWSLDLIGGSSYLWHYKHAVFHHTYVNITHEDTDIDLGWLARFSPHQRRYWFHRWQHFYIWPLYGLFVIKWHLYDDFMEASIGRVGEHRIPRPKGWEMVTFITGKVIFLALAFGIPLIFHPIAVVLLFYAVVAIVLGSVLSIVFLLAHAVEAADFPMPLIATGDMGNTWAVHQVETTVDFAHGSRVAAWLLGGLNFQIEHHLLPRICHIHFPALSKIVKATCSKFNVQYNEHRTIRAGIASHFRWLRQLGRFDTTIVL